MQYFKQTRDIPLELYKIINIFNPVKPTVYTCSKEIVIMLLLVLFL